ncbi:MAG: zinc-ribbon domain-containing protein [Clostridia bacterium]|nr:zinc-ribbon domain-containing protein [Clostridia bacterium]
MSKFCTKCGKELTDDSSFCSACGSKQEPVINEETQTKSIENEILPTTTPKSPVSNFLSNTPSTLSTIIKQFLLCLLSLIMFINIFLPVKSITIDYNDEKVELGITPIDSIIFTVDSFSSLSSEEIEDSKLYESLLDDTEALNEELQDNDGEFNEESTALFNSAVKKTARLLFMSEDYETNIFLISEGIISVVYIVVSVLFLVYSILKLLNYLGILNNKVYPKTYGLSGFTLAIFIGLYTLFSVEDFSIINVFLGNKLDVEMGVGSILGFISFGIIYAVIISIRFFFQKRLKPFNVIKSIVTLVTSILLILLCFGPAFNVEIKTQFSDASTKKTAIVEIYNGVYTDMKVKDEYKELLEDFEDATEDEISDGLEALLYRLSFYSKRDVTKGKANSIIYDIIKKSYYIQLEDFGFNISSITPIILTLINISVGYLISLILIRFMTNDYDVHAESRTKTLVLFFIILYTILNLVLILSVNSFFDTYLKNKFMLSLSIANIFALIVAVFIKFTDNLFNKPLSNNVMFYNKPLN